MGKDLNLLSKTSKTIKRPNRYVPTIHECKFCHDTFTKHFALEVHLVTYHTCSICSYRGNSLKSHVCVSQTGGILNAISNHVSKFKQVTALRGHIATYKYSCTPHLEPIQSFMEDLKIDVKEILKNHFRKRQQIKVQLCVWAIFKRLLGDSEYELSEPKALNSNLLVLLNIHGFDNFYKECIAKVNNSVEIFQIFGSGWKLHKILGFDVNISTYRPFLTGCNTALPNWLSGKQGIINIKCNDNKCFQWSFLAALHSPPINKNRISAYQEFVKKYDFSCMKWPSSLSQISKFEKLNKNRKIAINVFGYNNKSHTLYPLQISKSNYCLGHKTVNLLMTKCYETLEDKLLKESYLCHFSTISNINRLLGKRGDRTKQLCYSCLQRFTNRHDLKIHTVQCQKFNSQAVKLPCIKKDGKIPVHEFIHTYKKLKVSYIVYCDFESVLKKRYKGKFRKQKISIDSKINPFVMKEQRHKCSGFSWVLIRSDGKVIQKKVYRGPNAVPIFLKQMSNLKEQVLMFNRNIKPVIMNPRILNSIKDVEICHICEKPLEGDMVLDHDHVTGIIRSYAHNDCNMNFKQRNKLFIAFHNLKSYDNHLIVHGLRKFENIRIVPGGSSEKFLSIEIDHMIFIDSLAFLLKSLASLVENLSKSKHDFPILRQVFPSKLIPLLTRKGVFCYDYIDHISKFKKRQLPPRRKFYNFLTDKPVSSEDYKHAQDVFKKFKCKSVGSYHDLYLMSDTLLLAEVFENFRKMALAYYKVDPVYYYSTPGLAWDAALLYTKVKLEKLVDVDMYMFFEQAMKGGVTMITKRYAKARNMYTSNCYDDERSNYILYIDKNNLYGECMRWSLPINKFKWVKSDKVNLEEILATTFDSNIGYFLEVDLEYPDSLHNLHQDLPLAPESIIIQKDWLSSYQSTLLTKLKLNYNEKQKKLVSHLGPRSNYIVHYENLKYYVESGLRVTAVHRVLQFNQSKWLKTFIDFNTARRAEGQTDFEKDFFKLINNAIYGKSCQNMRKQQNIRITNKVDLGVKLVSSPLCTQVKILRPDRGQCSGLIQVSMKPKLVKLDKPLYIGCSVLELSKLAMFFFHYNKIKKWYKEKAQLLMTDTDSLIYVIDTADIYEDMQLRSKYFDFSNYDKNHLLYSEKNKQKIGKMKDELKGKVITSFVGPGIKTYSILTTEGEQMSKAKAVKKSIKEEYLLHHVYKNVLKKQNRIYSLSRHIRSYKHKLFTILAYKAAMHPFDSKRFILPNGIDTLPYFHYKLRKLDK